MNAKDARAMTVEELRSKEKELKKDLFNLRMQKSLGQAENPMRIRHTRRAVARVKTIIFEKEK
ncbi:MAG: 50S ribosomal protein L29 [Thermodesulfobacteriota bacterium]